MKTRPPARRTCARERLVEALAAVALFAAGMTGGACRHAAAVDEPAREEEPDSRALAPLDLRDDTQDLLLTWIDDRGDAHQASHPADVPPEGRARVRAVVTTREDGTRALFYVADLNTKNADGSYPVSTMRRREWEALITQKRAAFAAPPDPADPEQEPETTGDRTPAPAAAFTVIVYGASWCGACHQAMAYLKSRRVPAIEKDIERDPAAESEMRAKLARAGVHGGSIPVIDVKGKILIGFEPHALEAAVRSARAVTL